MPVPSEIPGYKITIDDFEKTLKQKEASWGGCFVKAFDNSRNFFNKLKTVRRPGDLPGREDDKDVMLITILPAIVDDVLKRIALLEKKDYPQKFDGESAFYNKLDTLFTKKQLAYLRDNKIKNNALFKHLKFYTPGIGEHTKEKKYIGRFIKIMVFLCGVFDYKLVTDAEENGSYLVSLLQDEKPVKETSEFYLFYNRSRLDKNDLGVGKIEITNDDVTIEYYYKGDIKGEYRTVQAAGHVCTDYLVNSNIILLKDVKHSDASIESFFLIKKYNGQDDAQLYGIATFWNRNDDFPFSSAVVLIKTSCYDKRYPDGDTYSFKNVQAHRERNDMPPEIYYYLFHQTVSLEGILSNPNKDEKTKHFTDYSHIPFYTEESRYLPDIAGRYKGLTVMDIDEKASILISNLTIYDNGVIEFIIELKDSFAKPEDINNTIGFVKYIHIDTGVTGKIYLSLRHHYALQFNTLNMFLEFNMQDCKKGRKKRIEEGHKLMLTGGLAGDSLITKKPITATILFEEIIDGSKPDISRIEISRNNRIINPEAETLINKHTELFDAYIKQNSIYSNYHGISLLKAIRNQPVSNLQLVNKKAYDVFIAIPLAHNNNKAEYDKNCAIAKGLRKQLAERMPFKSERIYCACFTKDGHLEFDDYREEAIRSEIRRRRKYDELVKTIADSEYLFLVYPKVNGRGRISSAIAEAGYAMGLGKKIAILCDIKEEKTLPENLTSINYQTTFLFDSDLIPVFDDFFNSDDFDRLKVGLGIK